ncbi:MAG TPA: sigma-54-dependent Fis family transcriptional regulator [Gammaproteobacteria bacterium]|nr:sigma-54-dependent Fis family transcriptional regulator [Gammaproteobacteria bacterium]
MTELGARALVVDDEPDIRELIGLTLGRMGVTCKSAANLAEARSCLRAQAFDLCLTDMRLPDGTGIELVEHIQVHCPRTPVAVITAHGNMESAIQSLKAGAFDFVSKPVELQLLRRLVHGALKLSLPGPAAAPTAGQQLLGESAAIRKIRAMIEKLARSQAPVYISGESGVGKELVAQLIHERGPRADRAFVPVNCGAIPGELMESEFFGHKKGSFTGAHADKEGLFQAADGGTLFLDEVADLPLAMQVKLLRAIQEKSVRPIGAQKEIPVDVRILCATHKNLAALVDSGEFRQDLYYRLNVIELRVPGLRERPGDIPLLARHFLGQAAIAGDMPVPQLSDAALAALERYPFPGNVRELENILERAITLCESHTIQAEDLKLRGEDVAPGNKSSPIPDMLEDNEPMALEPYLDSVEKRAITRALEKTRYNKTAAAKLLGLSFRALRYRLKKLGLD